MDSVSPYGRTPHSPQTRFGSVFNVRYHEGGEPLTGNDADDANQIFDTLLQGNFPYTPLPTMKPEQQSLADRVKGVRDTVFKRLGLIDPEFAADPVATTINTFEENGDMVLLTGKDARPFLDLHQQYRNPPAGQPRMDHKTYETRQRALEDQAFAKPRQARTIQVEMARDTLPAHDPTDETERKDLQVEALAGRLGLSGWGVVRNISVS